MVVDELIDFIRGAGYVLDVSDASFAQFFTADLDVDICDPSYSDMGARKESVSSASSRRWTTERR